MNRYWSSTLLIAAVLLPRAAHGQDLQFTSTSAPHSGSTAQAGSTFSVRSTIRNAGTKSINKNHTLQYFYCPGSSSSSCTALGTSSVTTNLSAGQSTTVTRYGLTMPGSALCGSGYIRFFVDSTSAVSETNEGNNNSYDPITVTAKPDLSITSSTVPYSGSTAAGGCTFTVRHTLRNAWSSCRFTTNFVMRYYYCPASSSSGCTQIGSATVGHDFNSGNSYTHTSGTLTLPTAATNGTRYIRAVADAENSVSESNENNNARFDSINVTGKPDLRITSDTAPNTGSTAGAGSTFTVRARLENDSCVSFSTNFNLDYFYCDDTSTSNCTKLGTSWVTNDFSSGETYWVTSGSLTMPNNARYGGRQIRFFADAGNLVSEGNEGNNNSYDSISVTKRPDLKWDSATVPELGDTKGPGSTFTAKHILLNAAGTSYLSTDFTVSYHYCPFKSSSGCTQLAQTSISNNFSAGEKYTLASLTLTLPATVAAGTRYLRTVADASSQVTEADETNNEHYAAITVSQGVAPPDAGADDAATDGAPPTDAATDATKKGEGWHWPDSTSKEAGANPWENPEHGCSCRVAARAPPVRWLPLLSLLLVIWRRRPK